MLDSHQKTFAASRAGHFVEEVVSVTVSKKRGANVVRKDKQIRHDPSTDQLTVLEPAFRCGGSITVGNISRLDDGMASVILTSARTVTQYGLRPLVEIVTFDEGGVDPAMTGLGPLPAMTCALHRGRPQLGDMARLEINEILAVQVLGVVRGLAREHQITVEEIAAHPNVGGGAVALGYPLGSPGTRIVMSLLHALRRESKSTGLVSLCTGGRMGIVLIVRTI